MSLWCEAWQLFERTYFLNEFVKTFKSNCRKICRDRSLWVERSCPRNTFKMSGGHSIALSYRLPVLISCKFVKRMSVCKKTLVVCLQYQTTEKKSGNDKVIRGNFLSARWICQTVPYNCVTAFKVMQFSTSVMFQTQTDTCQELFSHVSAW